MRSLVMAFNLFMTALSAALGEAFVSLSADPLLVWNYGSMAVISFIGGVLFYLSFIQLDRDEDRLNALAAGHMHHEEQEADVERKASGGGSDGFVDEAPTNPEKAPARNGA
jgi:POT family proton-dependent oligopeptide transporter